MSILKFPDGFLWGAGTSAFQVEGQITNSDWYRWEQTHQPPEFRSGIAADQYNRYLEDFSLAKSLGHNAHRLSLEWSRIEPEPGVFNQEEIDHYIKVLKTLKQKGFTVMLTLHHFSNPIWFADLGGWASIWSPYYFDRFVKKIVPELKEYVDLWITINEPTVYAFTAYRIGKFPPNKRSLYLQLKVLVNMTRAHNKAYKSIHKLLKNPKVGVTHNITSYTILEQHNLKTHFKQWLKNLINNHAFYKLTGIKTHDFLGVNYYFNEYIDPQPQLKNNLEVSDLGWEIYPEGIFSILVDLSGYKLPIYITENGVAAKDDNQRVKYLISHLKQVHRAINAGLNIKGYFHWSLLDNYEWVEGFKAKFGLIEVNFKNQKRTPRPSAYLYREIIRSNGISEKFVNY